MEVLQELKIVIFAFVKIIENDVASPGSYGKIAIYFRNVAVFVLYGDREDKSRVSVVKFALGKIDHVLIEPAVSKVGGKQIFTVFPSVVQVATVVSITLQLCDTFMVYSFLILELYLDFMDTFAVPSTFIRA